MNTITSLIRNAAVLLLLACAVFAQTQGSTTITFQANGAAQPIGCDATPPNGAPAGTTVEITKIEEQTTDGGWTDVTSAWSRSDNPSEKVKVRKPDGVSITGKTFRLSWKTSNTIEGHIVLTQVY